MSRWGHIAWGAGPWGWFRARPASAALLGEPYRLEVYDYDLRLVGSLPYWNDGMLQEELNGFPELTFSYPYEDAAAAYLTKGYLIGVREQSGGLLGLFHVTRRTKRRNEEGALTVRLECHGLMAQLGREATIESYEVEEPAPVAQIMSGLFATQSNGVLKPILLGGMDKSIALAERTLSVRNGTVLSAIRDLHATLGGFYWVDSSRRFYWVAKNPRSVRQEIRVGKNLPGLEVEEDFSGVYTRVTGLGHGVDDATRLQTTVDGDNQEVYGVIRGMFSSPGIRDEAQLTQKAERLAGQWSRPKKTYRCEALDLSHYQGPLDYRHEALATGTRVRLIDEALGEEFTTTIIRTSRRLDDPMSVTIEVGNPDEDITVDGVAPRDNVVEILASVIEDAAALRYRDPGVMESVRLGPLDDGTQFPWLARFFEAPDLTALDGLPGSAPYENLAYRDGDFARAADQLYVRDGGEWRSLNELLEPGSNIQAVGSSNSSGSDPRYARVDHVHAGPQPGANIQAVGTANNPGYEDAWARVDHVHEGATSFGEDTQYVGETTTDGTSDDAARSDHVHAAFELVSARDQLPESPVCPFAKTSDNGYLYYHTGVKWVCISHLEAEEE